MKITGSVMISKTATVNGSFAKESPRVNFMYPVIVFSKYAITGKTYASMIIHTNNTIFIKILINPAKGICP
jgi:hypothetical protein